MAAVASGCGGDTGSAGHQPAACGPNRQYVAAEWSGGLVLGMLDGSSRRLTRAADGEPSWSPDGRTLLFARGGDGFENDRYELMVMPVGPDGDTGDARSWVENLEGWAEETLPTAWSPSGDVAYAGSGVYVRSADGAELTRVANSGQLDWSPDGRRLSVTSSGSAIAIVTLSPTIDVLRLRVPKEAVAASWRNSDTLTVEASRLAGNRYVSRLVDIRVSSAGGRSSTLPGQMADASSDRAPSWSRDGRCLLFTRRDADGDAVMVYDSVSETLRKVMQGGYRTLRWRPVAP